MSTDKINELPKEIQLLILSDCSVETLGIVAQLSTFWNKISCDDYLWKPKKFLYRTVSDNISWKEYQKEQHIIMVADTLGGSYGWYEKEKKIKKWMNLEYKVIPYNSRAFQKALELKDKFKYKEALVALNYVKELESPTVLGLLGDLLYATQQDSKYYYKLYYSMNEYCTVKNDTKMVDAAIREDVQHVEILLSSGAYVDQRDDKHRSTALMFAVQRGDFKITKLLLENGADIYLKSEVYNYAVFDFATQNLNLNIMSLLFNNGLDINTKHSTCGSTALMSAIKQNKTVIVKYLLKLGAVIDELVFDYAMIDINIIIMYLLLDYGMDVNKRHSKYESTAIMFAAQQNNIDVVELLLLKGADISLKSINGHTVFNYTTSVTIDHKLQNYKNYIY